MPRIWAVDGQLCRLQSLPSHNNERPSQHANGDRNDRSAQLPTGRLATSAATTIRPLSRRTRWPSKTVVNPGQPSGSLQCIVGCDDVGQGGKFRPLRDRDRLSCFESETIRASAHVSFTMLLERILTWL